MNPTVTLKLRYAIAYALALACGGVAGVSAHLTFVPMADWSIWHRALWLIIASGTASGGWALIEDATNARGSLRHMLRVERQKPFGNLKTPAVTHASDSLDNLWRH